MLWIIARLRPCFFMPDRQAKKLWPGRLEPYQIGPKLVPKYHSWVGSRVVNWGCRLLPARPIRKTRGSTYVD